MEGSACVQGNIEAFDRLTVDQGIGNHAGKSARRLIGTSRHIPKAEMFSAAKTHLGFFAFYIAWASVVTLADRRRSAITQRHARVVRLSTS